MLAPDSSVLGLGMRIVKVRIENYRAFEDETVTLSDLTCLVGMNGAGKSTFLNALNLFFQDRSGATDPTRLTEEDFHKKDTTRRISVTVTFGNLSSTALEELRDYVRAGQLVVSAVAEWDAANGARVRQIGSRLGICAFAPCFSATSAGACKAIYDELREHYSLPSWRNRDAAQESLRSFEAEHPDQAELLESEDSFYGIAGASKLRRHVQWVYVPAIKDARDEQAESRDGALGKLLARTVRLASNFQAPLDQLRARVTAEMEELFAESQQHLDEVARTLTVRLADWSHEDARVLLGWEPTVVTLKSPNARASVSEGEFEGEIARFGHGFQRSYLLSLLQVLADDGGENAPTLILACEEPELYQHPPQARHMASVLRRLTDTGSQVLATSHSPIFVSTEFFDGVRVMRRADRSSPTRVSSFSFDDYARRISELTGRQKQRPAAVAAQLTDCLRPELNELFFARRLVLVEGTEDRAYLLTWAHLTGLAKNFRRQGVEVLAAGGKSTCVQLAVISIGLQIPTYLVFDSDGSSEHREDHRRDNLALLNLAGAVSPSAFPETARTGPRYSQWPNEMSDLIHSELSASLGGTQLNLICEQARNACGNAPRLTKNSIYIQELLTRAHSAGARSMTLDATCDSICSAEW